MSGTFAVAASTGTQFNASNIRSAATDGAGNFWAAGTSSPLGTGGVGYLGTGTVAQVLAGNFRAVNLFNGELYFSTASTTQGEGIHRFTGTPTSAATSTPLNVVGGQSPYGFSINPAGTVMYVADDRTIASGGGIQRWNKSGATWSLAYTLGTGGSSTLGVRGLVVNWSGASPVIHATTTEPSNNRLITVADTGTAPGTATLVASAGTNRVFRGVAFAPALPPTVTLAPLAPSVIANQNITFTASPGEVGLLYQWFKNAVAIAGATTATYTATSVPITDNGASFSCTVTRPGDGLTASAATLLTVILSSTNALVLMPDGDFASGGAGWTEGGLINSFSYPVSGGNPGGYGIMNAFSGLSGYWVGNNNAAISITSLGLTAGNCYTFSQDMRIEGGIGTNIGGLKVEFIPSGTTGEMRIPLIGNGTTWETYNFNVLIPVGTTSIKIVPLWGLNSNVGFDNFTVENAPTNPPQVGIPNPGFSIPTASGWERSGPLTGFTYPTSGGNPGGFGVMNASNGEWGVFVSNNSVILPLSGLSLTVGQTYSFTQDMKVFSGTNVGGLKVEFYNGTTAIGDTGNVYKPKIGTGSTWETYTFTVLIPPNTTGIKLVPIWGPNSSVGFDNFAIMPAPPAAPPQATIAPATKVNWTPTSMFNSYQPQKSLDNVVYTVVGPANTGTAVNSVFDAGKAPFYRVMESLPGIQEAIYNGGFTEEEFDPSSALGWQPITGQPPTRLLTGGRGDNGPCMRIKVVDLGGASASEIQQNTKNAHYIATQDAVSGTVSPGQTCNFEFWAKQISSNGAYEQRYKVSFLSDYGGVMNDGTFQNFSSPIGVWTKFTLNGLVVPAGATSALIQILGVTGTTAGDAGEVLIDDVFLSGQGSGPPTLFTTTTAPAVGISWQIGRAHV